MIPGGNHGDDKIHIDIKGDAGANKGGAINDLLARSNIHVPDNLGSSSTSDLANKVNTKGKKDRQQAQEVKNLNPFAYQPYDKPSTMKTFI